MTSKEDLVTQHIREYESRLKHIEELYDRADKATAHLDESHDSRNELRELEKERLRLQTETGDIQTISTKNWRDDMLHKSGPMAIWDLFAQKLEEFLERHE